MSPEEQLKSRPSFAEASQEYLAMLDAMRARLSVVEPALQWRTERSAQDGSSGCQPPLGEVEGSVRANYDSGDALGGIDDATWPAALAEVTAVAAEHGFTKVSVVLDKPGSHQVSFWDELEAEVVFGAEVNTILSVYGACFLEGPG